MITLRSISDLDLIISRWATDSILRIYIIMKDYNIVFCEDHMEYIMITARGLIKTYNGQSAVGGIDFHVKKGDVFGIIGPNGAGKTTTLKMISGLIPVSYTHLTLPTTPYV